LPAPTLSRGVIETAKADRFIVKWGITKEKLIDNTGKVISDAILTKAEKFLSAGLVEKLPDGYDRSRYIVKPIEGYNNTAYTVYLSYDGQDVIGSCNCQYAQYNKLCSHLLAVLIKENAYNYHNRITVRGGVRN